MLVKSGTKFINIGSLFVDVQIDEPIDPIIEKHYSMYKIEDVYSMVKPDERIVIVSRHAHRGGDTTITGDLDSTGIQQCKTLGAKLTNPNIDLTKTYIGGSLKYRAKNTAYQVTKAMGVEYPSDYNYITDTDEYPELMEINFFCSIDPKTQEWVSSSIDIGKNSYYSYIDDTIYNGPNKVEDHVNTKAKELIDIMLNTAKEKDVDLAWFGSHDKTVNPLLAYVTDKNQGGKETIHIERTNKDQTIKIINPITGVSNGADWYIPLLAGIAFIVNKNTGNIKIYPFESSYSYT